MKNPLLQHKFATPHDTFPFADITVPDIEAALLKGIEIELGEVDAIARSADEPSFRNTIVALSYAGKMLERASTLMYNQLSANTSDELEQCKHHAQRASLPQSAYGLRRRKTETHAHRRGCHALAGYVRQFCAFGSGTP